MIFDISSDTSSISDPFTSTECIASESISNNGIPTDSSTCDVQLLSNLQADMSSKLILAEKPTVETATTQQVDIESDEECLPRVMSKLDIPLERAIPLLPLTSFHKGNHFRAQDQTEAWLNKPVFQQREPLIVKVRQMLTDNTCPDLAVKIGEHQFSCHFLILSCFSEYVANIKNISDTLILPEDKVTQQAFDTIYKWMLQDEQNIARDGIIELLAAATFLDVKDLLKQIWYCIESPEYFIDIEAFLLCKEARMCPGLEFIEKMMLERVGTSFLCIVAATEFAELPASSLANLLDSNRIAVNTEKEVFFAAIRWTSCDWPARAAHIASVFKNVRMELLPTKFLLSLKKPTGYTAVDQVTAHAEFKKLLSDAFFGQTLVHYGGDTEPFRNIYSQFDIRLTAPRQFIYDRHCHYHKPEPNDKQDDISYLDFINYLRLLHRMSYNYWRQLQPCVITNYKPK